MAILPALSLNVGSPEPERLIAFYRDTLGLTPAPDGNYCQLIETPETRALRG